MDVRTLNGSRPEGQSGAGQQIVQGYVSTERPAPASFADPVYVIVPSHSSDAPYGPLSWPADHGSTLPAQGTPVTLALTVGLDGTPNVPAVIGWDAPNAPVVRAPFFNPLQAALLSTQGNV